MSDWQYQRQRPGSEPDSEPTQPIWPGGGYQGYPGGQRYPGYYGYPPGYPYGYPPPESSRRPGPRPGAVVAAVLAFSVLCAGAVAGVVLGIEYAVHRSPSGATSATQQPGGVAIPAPVATPSPDESLDPTAIATAVNPAVVDVNSVLGYENARAAGTGIVIKSSGIVLTNNHVVSGATSISVTEVTNGRSFDATVLGYDRSDDIAVLQLAGASGLRTATLADSSRVTVGDAVVAIGNAGGAGGTPSMVTGQVTALNRSITASDQGSGVSEQLTGLIEVAAAIEAGDSGGPLVNSGAQVIGIDTAATAGFQYRASGGQGFAIPINSAVTIANQILRNQASDNVHLGQTAFLGVNVAPAGTGGEAGVGVAGVVSDSPAVAAGIVAGDLIVSVDGQPVDSPNTLASLLDGHHPGDRVTIGWVDRSGQPRSAIVDLASGPVG